MRAEVSPATAEQNALDKPWRAWVSVAVGTFVLVSLTLGLFILPSIEQAGANPFATICRAIGIPGYQRATSRVIANSAAMPNSDVSWTAKMLAFLQKGNATRGAKLAQETCAGCHGANGISPDPQQFPNLAGQVLAAVFKELRDFQAGTRKSEIMAAVAQSLTRQQMADVAAYYASRAPAPRIVAEHAVSPPIARIARQGDPDRAIPSCDSCHGQSRSGPVGTPVLLGEPVPYLEEQLKMFASGARSNDLYARMRIVARQFTPDEMHGLATYYSGMDERELATRGGGR
jgi:cytochrome c553